MSKLKNNAIFILYTVLLGVIVGVIIWAFLRIMNLGIDFLWGYLPSQTDFPLYTLCVCTAGGMIVGIWKHRFGDYPQELYIVLGRVKKTNRYPYHNVFSIIVSALLPLLIGASIGPEAGLTGIIAGLCTWVGDKLKRFHKELEELTAIGLSATLGTIFRSPMFGFMEPIESERDTVLPRSSKIVLYFSAILSSFGVFILLNHLLGGGAGIKSLESQGVEPAVYLWAVPLALVGIAGGYLYFFFKKLTSLFEKLLKRYVVLRAVCGGLLLGAAGTLLPLTMFSGEHQIHEVTEQLEQFSPWMLLCIAVVKLLMTNICIDSGLKGGHFFPVIFCGVAIGCSMSLLLNVDFCFCAAVVTTALVGHTLKKPLATVLLLMIVFPPRFIPIMLFAAITAKFIPTPKIILPVHSVKKPQTQEQNDKEKTK